MPGGAQAEPFHAAGAWPRSRDTTPDNKRTLGWGRARPSCTLPESVEPNLQPGFHANTHLSSFGTLLGKLHDEQGVRRTILGNCVEDHLELRIPTVCSAPSHWTEGPPQGQPSKQIRHHVGLVSAPLVFCRWPGTVREIPVETGPPFT
jgi:hypothetical protein